MDMLKMEEMKSDAKYLGIPSCWGKSKSETYGYLVERAVKKMQGWKAKELSYGGREIMIKSVVQAIPSYVMSCFLLPIQFCNKVNSHIRRFWWSGDPTESKIHWIKGEELCKPKWQGGMGFRDLRDFNLALLAKQAWRIINNPNAYWVRMLKGIYFPRTDFLNASRGARPSWIWSSLCQGRSLLEKGLRWQVNSGTQVKFWHDKWTPPSGTFKHFKQG